MTTLTAVELENCGISANVMDSGMGDCSVRCAFKHGGSIEGSMASCNYQIRVLEAVWHSKNKSGKSGQQTRFWEPSWEIEAGRRASGGRASVIGKTTLTFLKKTIETLDFNYYRLV